MAGLVLVARKPVLELIAPKHAAEEQGKGTFSAGSHCVDGEVIVGPLVVAERESARPLRRILLDELITGLVPLASKNRELRVILRRMSRPPRPAANSQATPSFPIAQGREFQAEQ